MKKIIFLLTVIFFLSVYKPISAHVSVKPVSISIAERANFVVGVPNEKDIPTVGLRLIIPEGLKSVRPLVKPGWKIETKYGSEKEEGNGEAVSTTTEISWTGGKIPEGQKDEFVISAQAPAEPATLIWKAYQTYFDGTIVSWDADPEMKSYEENSGPYSKTEVANDIAQKTVSDVLNKPDIALMVALVSLVVSLFSLLKSGGKRK